MTEKISAPPQADSLWKSVLAALKSELSEQTFKTWIEPIRFVSHETGVVILKTPNPFFGDWIRIHYEGIIATAFSHLIHEKPEIRLMVDQVLPQTSNPPLQEKSVPKNTGLNAKYRFENFVVGPGNRMACAAAIAVSETPAKTYNPLFIYGPVGLGKTHLMQAIAQAISERDAQKRTLFLSSETFTNQLISAIQNRSTPQFRAKYRFVDVLLIDDIHFIAGKEATMEEFFHTFNALYDSQKQLVISSDRPPKEIPSLEERLISRFEWGLVVDIQPPNLETRIAILKKKMERETVSVSDDVLFFIAGKIKSNIRELEGALIRVIAKATLEGVVLNVETVKNILADSLQEEERKVTIDLIQRKVAESFSLTVSEMRSKKRVKSINLPRQIAMYLVRELTEHSLPEIGEFFGGRNHATVIHACQKIKSEIVKNPKIKGWIESISQSIKGY